MFKNFSFIRVGVATLAGSALLATSLFLYEVHRPGFNPKNLPCSGSHLVAQMQAGPNLRSTLCESQDGIFYFEIWEKRILDRWVRTETEIVEPFDQDLKN